MFIKAGLPLPVQEMTIVDGDGHGPTDVTIPTPTPTTLCGSNLTSLVITTFSHSPDLGFIAGFSESLRSLKIDLRRNPRRVQDLSFLKNLKSLTSLSLIGFVNIDASGLQCIPPSVRSLTIHWNKNLVDLANLPDTITHLTLNNCKKIQHIAKAPSSLESLAVYGGMLTHRGIVINIPTLKALDLERADFINFNLSRTGQLKSLALDGASDLTFFANVDFSSLERLHIQIKAVDLLFGTPTDISPLLALGGTLKHLTMDVHTADGAREILESMPALASYKIDTWFGSITK